MMNALDLMRDMVDTDNENETSIVVSSPSDVFLTTSHQNTTSTNTSFSSSYPPTPPPPTLPTQVQRSPAAPPTWQTPHRNDMAPQPRKYRWAAMEVVVAPPAVGKRYEHRAHRLCQGQVQRAVQTPSHPGVWHHPLTECHCPVQAVWDLQA